MMFMVCESPLHAGTGSDLDFIDSPIQREKHTQFPKIEGSSLKGAMREHFRQFFTEKDNEKDNAKDMVAAFGPFRPNGDPGHGALGFSDARLLLFPVKSMQGVFAWITCPRVLQRFQDDMRRLPGQEDFEIKDLPEVKVGEACIFGTAIAFCPNGKKEKGKIVLEEFDFTTNCDSAKSIKTKIKEDGLNTWLADTIYPNKEDKYWNTNLKENLVILSDTDFADFVEYSTEVITRNRIDPETGVVEEGALFTEEYLPSDSVLYSLVLAQPEFKNGGCSADEILKIFTSKMEKGASTFRLGGNATIGKGVMRAILTTNSTENEESNGK